MRISRTEDSDGRQGRLERGPRTREPRPRPLCPDKACRAKLQVSLLVDCVTVRELVRVAGVGQVRGPELEIHADEQSGKGVRSRASVHPSFGAWTLPLADVKPNDLMTSGTGDGDGNGVGRVGTDEATGELDWHAATAKAPAINRTRRCMLASLSGGVSLPKRRRLF